MPDGVSRLTVSYMGRPMTIVASLLLAFMSNLFELLQLIRRRNIEGDARPTPQEDHKPPVRLDNLADVSRAHRAKPRVVAASGDTKERKPLEMEPLLSFLLLLPCLSLLQ